MSYYVRGDRDVKFHVIEDAVGITTQTLCGLQRKTSPRHTFGDLRAYGPRWLGEAICRKCRPWIAGRSQFAETGR